MDQKKTRTAYVSRKPVRITKSFNEYKAESLMLTKRMILAAHKEGMRGVDIAKAVNVPVKVVYNLISKAPKPAPASVIKTGKPKLTVIKTGKPSDSSAMNVTVNINAA